VRRSWEDGRRKREEGRKEGNKIKAVRELTDCGQIEAETETWLDFSFQYKYIDEETLS